MDRHLLFKSFSHNHSDIPKGLELPVELPVASFIPLIHSHVVTVLVRGAFWIITLGVCAASVLGQ